MAMEWLRKAAAERAAKWLQSAQERQRQLQERLEAKEGQKAGEKAGGKGAGEESKRSAEGLKASALSGAEVSAGELWRLYRSARGSDSARRETLDLLAARAGSEPEGPRG